MLAVIRTILKTPTGDLLATDSNITVAKRTTDQSNIVLCCRRCDTSSSFLAAQISSSYFSKADYSHTYRCRRCAAIASFRVEEQEVIEPPVPRLASRRKRIAFIDGDALH